MYTYRRHPLRSRALDLVEYTRARARRDSGLCGPLAGGTYATGMFV